MDLGLGNLVELKRQLLASALQNGTQHDAKLQAIGIGVAKSFEKYCNRKFGRAVADVYQFPADRDHVFVPRFPVEAVTAVEFRPSMDTGWLTQDLTCVINRNDASGGIYFAGVFGYWWAQLRVTYTGGFWYDAAETEDTAQPGGTTKLPEDLKLAWYLQCGKVWQSIDKLGAKITQGGPTGQAAGPGQLTEGLMSIQLVPAVTQVLDAYKRYAIT